MTSALVTKSPSEPPGKNMKIVKRKPLYYIGIIVGITGLLGLNFTEAALSQIISQIIIVLGLGLIIKGQVEVR